MATKPDPNADPNEGVSFNMTPMIDVVFQLIIFLMLANDMSRKEIEDLNLPEAMHATEDKGEKEKYRVIVNLLKPEKPGQPPILKIRGEQIYDLAVFQQKIKPDADRQREDEQPHASELYVLIRADRDARWQDVQWVMQALAEPQANLRVYKMQFATHNPQPDLDAGPPEK